MYQTLCLLYCKYACNHVKYLKRFFNFIGFPCSMSCKSCIGVSCHNRQISEEDNEYKNGEDKTTLEYQKT